MTLIDHIRTRVSRLGRPQNPDAMTLIDLGLTRSEFETLRNSRPETDDQIAGMARHFGTSREALAQDRWRELEVALSCAQCRNSKACQNFLNGQGGFSRETCPNAETFADLANRG